MNPSARKAGNDVWLIADTHFGHRRMVEMCGRPEDFGDRIVKNIRQAVLGEADMILHLGDVAIGAGGKPFTEQMLNRPRYRCVLVRGNHDTQSIWAGMDAGWAFVCDALTLNFGGKRIVFSHEPLVTFDGDLNVHGHLHNNNHRGEQLNDGRHILISMEFLDYRPISLRKVVELNATPVWQGGRFIAQP